jgi:hypothetical protein
MRSDHEIRKADQFDNLFSLGFSGIAQSLAPLLIPIPAAA